MMQRIILDKGAILDLVFGTYWAFTVIVKIRRITQISHGEEDTKQVRQHLKTGIKL